MRTKTLLLTAALSTAGIASSMAQVYSVNAVGYVNTDLVAGFNLVSNPLLTEANTIGELFADLPAGTQVFKFDGTYTTATKDLFSGTYLPQSAADLTVDPGEGVFVSLPAGSAAQQITFVGEVPQGQLSNPIPAGLSIRSSEVPQAGPVSGPGDDDLNFPGVAGDQIFKYNSDPANGTVGYTTYTFDLFAQTWLPSIPVLEVGEAVFISKVTAADWTRDFSVNDTP